MRSRGRQAHTAAQHGAVGTAAGDRLTRPALRRNPNARRIAACTRCVERAYSQRAQSARARLARSVRAHGISYAGVCFDATRSRCVDGVTRQGSRAHKARMLRVRSRTCESTQHIPGEVAYKEMPQRADTSCNHDCRYPRARVQWTCLTACTQTFPCFHTCRATPIGSAPPRLPACAPCTPRANRRIWPLE